MFEALMTQDAEVRVQRWGSNTPPQTAEPDQVSGLGMNS